MNFFFYFSTALNKLFDKSKFRGPGYFREKTSGKIRVKTEKISNFKFPTRTTLKNSEKPANPTKNRFQHAAILAIQIFSVSITYHSPNRTFSHKPLSKQNFYSVYNKKRVTFQHFCFIVIPARSSFSF